VKRQDLIHFARQLSEEDDAASDLWSWLPSHAVAQKHHGDYASEHRPSNKDVMTEAALYLARLTRPGEPLTAEEKDWFETCPCDESHEKAAP